MKSLWWIPVLVVVFAILVLAGFFAIKNIQEQRNKEARDKMAETSFQIELGNNWDKIVAELRFLPKRLNKRDDLKSYAATQLRSYPKMPFNITEEYKGTYLSKQQDFENAVLKPFCQLLDDLSGDLNHDQINSVVRDAKTLDEANADFFRQHPTFKQASQIQETVKNGLEKLYPKEQPVTTTKIIYVYSGDSGTSTPVSLSPQIYGSLDHLAREFFGSRTILNRLIVWQRMRDPNYVVANIEILQEALNKRIELYNELIRLENQGSSSALSRQLKNMLNNSIQALRILIDTHDYYRFKPLSDQNNTLETDIRRTFNIR